MKKFTKILGSIGLALVLLLGVGALFGAFDDAVADLTDGAMADNTRLMVETEDGRLIEVKTNDGEVEEESKTEVVESIQGGIELGTVITYIDMGTITITDVGLDQDMENKPLVYVEIEIENTSDSTISVFNSDFSMYIDDYQVDVIKGYRNLEDVNASAGAEVNPGRKMKYTFRGLLPSGYENASNIEIGFPGNPDGTLFIKKDGEYLWTQGAPTESSDASSSGSGLYEGWFENGDLYKIDDQSIVMTLAPAGFDGPDAEVYIEYDYTHQYLLYMEDERNGYLTYMEDEERAGTLSFTMDGVVVDCDIPEMDGTYWY